MNDNLNVKVDLAYFELQAVINALSRDIIRLDNASDLPYLNVAIDTYLKLKKIADKLWPDWLITNDEVKKIIAKHS